MDVESKKNLKRKHRALDVSKEEESKKGKLLQGVKKRTKEKKREKKKNRIPQRHVASKAKQKAARAVKPVNKGKAKSTEYLPRGKQILSAALPEQHNRKKCHKPRRPL